MSERASERKEGKKMMRSNVFITIKKMPKVRFKVNGEKARFESSTSKSRIIFMFKMNDQKRKRARKLNR